MSFLAKKGWLIVIWTGFGKLGGQTMKNSLRTKVCVKGCSYVFEQMAHLYVCAYQYCDVDGKKM